MGKFEASLGAIFRKKEEAFFEVVFLLQEKNNVTDYKVLNTNTVYTG
jgi:hypothetical protein